MNLQIGLVDHGAMHFILGSRMDRRTIFSLESRGHNWIFHWFVFMIGGLRHIGKETGRYGPDGFDVREQNESEYNIETLQPPYYITMGPKAEVVSQIHNETFETIKDTYKFIKTPTEDDIVINSYGELSNYDGRENHIDPECYKFLNKLFMDRVKLNDTHKNKRYFISTHTIH